jgi:hypothetical protein
MSQKENNEWRNERLSCKHVVHRLYVNPIARDACCSSLEEKVPLFDLPPPFLCWSVDGKK